MRAIRRIVPLLVVAAGVLPLHAQTPNAKRALTQADWDRWRSITGPALSNDGRWAAYTLIPQVGDGELVVRATQGATEYRVPRGFLGRPNNVPGGLRPPAGPNPEAEPVGPAAPPAQFSADGRFAVVLTQPAQAEVERMQAARGPRGRAAPATTRTSLAILSTADGKLTAIPNVRSFRLPRQSGRWLFYVAGDSSADSTARGGGGGGGAGGASRERRSYGTPLVLRDLDRGAEERLDDVLAYTFDDSAKVLAYTVVSRDSTRDGAFLKNLATGATTTFLAGRGNYKAIALDSLAKQVAFLSDRDELGAGKDRARYTLYYTTLKAAAPAPVVTAAALSADLHLADNASVSFTRTGNAILFGVAPTIPDSVPADSLAGKAVFDLWHWKDPTLQPAQRLSAVRDRNRWFRAIYFPATKKYAQLANDSIPTVDVSDDGRVAAASSRERYRIEAMWGDGGSDVYVIDPATSQAKLIREKISGQADLSPDGKYLAFYDNGHWYSYTTATGRTLDLTGPIGGVSFAQETWDTPSIPSAWGLAGWTRGDKSLLLYDRWDVWDLDPAGVRPPVMVTDSLGRTQHLVLRLVQVSRRGGGGGAGGGGGGGPGGFGVGGLSREPIDPAEPLLLRAVDDETKASGFYRDRLGPRQPPEKLVMGDLAFGAPVKAADADVWMVTKSTFVDFPDLWVGPSLTRLARISDANPQQKEFNWGTVELVRWTSADGVPLKGLLFKPENFDSTRQYPMIAYFYEDLSQNRHTYVAPNGRNVINPTHYVSNGYLIFEPDIHYEIGFPGPSAVKSIVPGVQMLLARGYVDPKRLGLQGQSWGGYQTAFLITQTHLFSAAMAGAPVANMTSAYGGIRWGSGLARPFQYEASQSRIGRSIWEAPMRYLENSPLFWLDKVTTPLFIMSNDMDDAVPWYQGIELFVGMRRLGKEVYLIDYNNDVHNPQGRANQKDVAMRMQQFFDAKLKGAPAPLWMVKGIPYLAKGRDQLGAPGAAATGQATGQPQPGERERP
ncbi:MAG TPA: prolyl oligopeptidase family serine peptidase [Gemmatimonadales bacterium]|jgi:dipeptidyl aminopeptidase/acylaminoacyl peptidase|nr:prolyl oligopeptidase family serine peptidase [Gemmatimonadales bacterium]